jgi:hypothetical protein
MPELTKLFSVQGFEQLKQLIVCGDILHGFAVVDVAGRSLLIHDHLGRHPPELEEVDFLTEQLQDACFWIRQPGIRQAFFLPIRPEFLTIFRTCNQNNGFLFHELIVILAQLRQMLTAVRSGKAPVKDQKYIGFLTVIR